METINSRISQYPPPQSAPLRATNNHQFRRCCHHNAQRQSSFTMPLTDLALLRIIHTPYQFRFNRHPPKSFFLTAINVDAMADESTKKHISSEAIELNPANRSIEEKEKASGKPTPAVPPPPEKPLPGDCCGSGCVRCVWDVYYEELDEYERLYKSNSKSS